MGLIRSGGLESDRYSRAGGMSLSSRSRHGTYRSGLSLIPRSTARTSGDAVRSPAIYRRADASICSTHWQGY